jgi:ACS family allantoate permease-like MFS transporter
MICWGIVVICIGFCQNFAQLMALRAMQGLFECTISPGFLFIIGSWYKTEEHSSRALIFESAISGVLIFTSLMIYGIGTAAQHHGKAESAWRYISYVSHSHDRVNIGESLLTVLQFLGALTTIIGVLCLFVLGTPSEVSWLAPEEKEMVCTSLI